MGYVELVLRVEGTFRRLYARKRLHAHYRQDPELRQMFVEEARLAGLLRHPNVIGVLDVGEDDEGPYLVMDYVEGVSVSALIADVRKGEDLLPVSVCVEVARQTALALAAAHTLRDVDGKRLELVHRDVSPQNVLIDYEGIVRLGDFGVAKALGRAMASTTDALKGKVGYMSPEQLRFEPLDHRSDLFALGVVLYELLAAERLYAGRDVPTVARAILNGPPPDLGEQRPDVPPALEELLLDLLARSPLDRPADAADVARRLGAIGRRLEDEAQLELATLMRQNFGERRAELQAERALAIEDAVSHARASERPVRPVLVDSGRSYSGPSDPDQPATRVEPLAPRGRSGKLAAGLVALGALILVSGIGVMAERELRGSPAAPPPPEPPSAASPAALAHTQTPPELAPPVEVREPRSVPPEEVSPSTDQEATPPSAELEAPIVEDEAAPVTPAPRRRARSAAPGDSDGPRRTTSEDARAARRRDGRLWEWP